MTDEETKTAEAAAAVETTEPGVQEPYWAADTDPDAEVVAAPAGTWAHQIADSSNAPEEAPAPRSRAKKGEGE